MPGAYAHMTLVNELREPQRLEAVPGFPIEAIPAILDYFRYCELGAVSPDYPYLAIGDGDAKRWADLMHKSRTGPVIHAGVRRIRTLNGEIQWKCLAWLLGYAAHFTTDVTIHPVVELKVGTYEGHEKAHRICEMHQDAYVFQRLNLGEPGMSEHLKSGVALCRDASDPDLLDRDIVSLWKGMLKDVHGDEFKRNPPDIDRWHRGFNFAIDKVAEEGTHLFSAAFEFLVGQGIVYPTRDRIDPGFIRGLSVPGDRTMDYDPIFDGAVGNVAVIWQILAAGALQGKRTYLSRVGDWNLDNGRDPGNRLVFWGKA